MTTDAFTTAARADRALRVRAWAASQYCSGTPLDQDRRMVAAETEAFLSGRTGRERSELSQAAKYAGPVDDPATQEPTDAEVLAALNAQGVIVSPKMHPAPSLDYWGERPAEAMRAALTAAKEARE